MSLAFPRNVRPPIVLEKAHVTLQSWHPSGCPFTKIDPEVFCNYLFQTERVARKRRRFLRCKSCIFLFKTELAEFAISQTILKTSLSLNCTMALYQSTKGPLLNFSKYYKPKSKPGYAKTKSKAKFFLLPKKQIRAFHDTA